MFALFINLQTWFISFNDQPINLVYVLFQKCHYKLLESTAAKNTLQHPIVAKNQQFKAV